MLQVIRAVLKDPNDHTVCYLLFANQVSGQSPECAVLGLGQALGKNLNGSAEMPRMCGTRGSADILAASGVVAAAEGARGLTLVHSSLHTWCSTLGAPHLGQPSPPADQGLWYTGWGRGGSEVPRTQALTVP